MGTAATLVSTRILKYLFELRKLEKLTDNVLVKGKQISNTLREANAFLNSERELIIEWTNNVETVTENIDSYPEEYSRKYAEIRSIFNDGLTDLQKTAQEFMNGGVSVGENVHFGITLCYGLKYFC